MSVTEATLHFDGGARPGNAAAGAVLTSMEGRTIAHVGAALGNVTNNVAESTGLNLGLQLAREHGIQDLRVFGDSDLTLGHVFRGWSIGTPHLEGLAMDSRELAKGFPKLRAQHVDRELNAPADAVCNAVADGWWAAPGGCRDDGTALLGFVVSLEIERARVDDVTRRSEIKRTLAGAIERAFSLARSTDVTRTGTKPYVRGELAIITYLVRLHVSPHVAGDLERRAAAEEKLLAEASERLGARRTRVARICG
jgi:ribonuclease HI